MRRGRRNVAEVLLEKGSLFITENARDTGDLLASGEVKEEAHASVAAWTAFHAKYVFFGAGPAIGNPRFWPPLEAIKQWVARNIRVIRVRDPFELRSSRQAIVKPSTKKDTVKASKDEVEEMARAIQAKIHRDGLKPKPFATAGSGEARRIGPGLVRDAINDELRRLG